MLAVLPEAGLRMEEKLNRQRPPPFLKSEGDPDSPHADCDWLIKKFYQDGTEITSASTGDPITDSWFSFSDAVDVGGTAGV